MDKRNQSKSDRTVARPHRGIATYYDDWGWIYPILWGQTIHWGLFKDGDESLTEAATAWSRRTIDLLRPRPQERYLELGCGPAMTSRQLILEHDVLVDGLDISGFQLHRARSASPDLIKRKKLSLFQGDIAGFRPRHRDYAGAFSEAVFFHLARRREAFLATRSALRKGARFVFDDLSRAAVIPEDLFRRAFGRFAGMQLETSSTYHQLLITTGFKIVECSSTSEDIARTYTRLLDSLTRENSRPHPRLSFEAYQRLTRSFRAITELLWDNKLVGQLFVAEAV